MTNGVVSVVKNGKVAGGSAMIRRLWWTIRPAVLYVTGITAGVLGYGLLAHWLGLLGVVLPLLMAIAVGMGIVTVCWLQERWESYDGRKKGGE